MLQASVAQGLPVLGFLNGWLADESRDIAGKPREFYRFQSLSFLMLVLRHLVGLRRQRFGLLQGPLLHKATQYVPARKGVKTHGLSVLFTERSTVLNHRATVIGHFVVAA
jgi:hypothetical protein